MFAEQRRGDLCSAAFLREVKMAEKTKPISYKTIMKNKKLEDFVGAKKKEKSKEEG